MSLIEELLESVKNEDTLDERVRQICDKIAAEEAPKLKEAKEEEILPIGANIFLALEVPNQKLNNRRTFLALERDEPGKFSLGIWEYFDGKNTRRIKSIEVRDNKEKKILRQFASQLKYLRGE